MALEKDFDLLDDYLSNRLSESDKTAFEQKLEADPELKQELKIQQDLMQGIRDARMAELKSMLNSVPVPPISNPTSLLIKAGTWTVISGLVITVAYYYFSKNGSQNGSQKTNEPAVITQSETKEISPVAVDPTEQIIPEVKSQPTETVKPAEKRGSEHTVTVPPSKQPELKVYDPSKETSEEPIDEVQKYEREQLELISRAFVTSSIEVETDNTHRKYSFHYMFNNGKLMLYGAFEKHLYEILEFISDDKRTVVLFYKTNYYLLDINKSTPTILTPIKDRALLKKLSEYRGH